MTARGLPALDRVRSFRGAGAAVVLLAVVIASSQLVGRAELTPLTGEPAAFELAPGGDDVARLAPITVTFAKPPSDRAPEPLLQLYPETKGAYAWLSPRTLLFQPDFPGLLRGSMYTVHVPARPEAGVPQPVTRKFTVTGKLTVQQVIPGDGDTEVPLGAQVFVQFSRSVAPLTTLAAQRADPVLVFEPPLHGKGEWLNTAIYRFIPADLVPTTTYRVTVARGLTSAADGVLESDFHSTFTTIAPAVDSITPDGGWLYGGPWQETVVVFNQPMDPSAADGLSVRDAQTGAPVRGKLTWNADRTTLTFNPAARMAASTKYLITVDKGQRGARGGATARERTASFTTVGVPAVKQTYPADGATDAQRYGISLQFTNPMDPDTLERKVSVSGFGAKELEDHVYTSEFSLGVNVALRPSTAYTVTLAPGAVDRYGQVMAGHRFSFTTGAVPSSVSLIVPGYQPAGSFSASAEPFVYFQSTNLANVGFSLYPLTSAEARGRMHDFTYLPNGFVPSQPVLRRWAETVSGPKDDVVVGKTSLTGGGPLAKGFYYLRIDGQRSELAFAVVDTVVVTKVSQDELLLWALDHDSGRPVPGAALHVDLTPGGDVVTDAQGLASVALPVLTPSKTAGGDRSFWITLDGGRFGAMSTRWFGGTSPYQFGLPAGYPRDYVGHLYTDRPIYTPGETISYKGVVRADDDARYSLPPKDGFLFVLRNARGQQLAKDDVHPNEFGSFAGAFDLPADAAVGDYFLGLEQKNGTSSFGIAGTSVLVASFRKPEFQVDVRAGRASYVDGDAIDAGVAASYFFGGAVDGASVDWSVLADPFFLRPKGFEGYSFSDFDYARQAVVRDPLRGKGVTTTAATGAATIAVRAALKAGEGPQRFTLSAAVTDANAQSVAGSTQVTVHPAALYAGVRPTSFLAREGQDATLQVVTVDTEGAVLPRHAVTVKVYERQWITVKEEVPGGGKRYRSEPRDTLVATLGATTGGDATARVTYRPAKSGQLRVVAEVTDAKGRVARSATWLWVTGKAFAYWQVTNDDTIKLVADKDRYEVGDTAELLVPAPFAGATGLVTVERGKVQTREVHTFVTNSERLRIPIVDRSVPDVFVSVVLYRAPTREDPVPRYKVGYVELPVSTATRALDVKITPDRAQTRPGETVRYAIKVTDHTGTGVRAEVSVAVVDKAVLSLQDERGPDGLHAFWYERGLGVNTSSSLATSIDRWNDAIAEAPRQGKGGSGSGSGAPGNVRQDFRNTAYWSAQLVTSADGSAQVDVTMPDDLTTWRTQARAISGDTQVGEGTNELVSTKPLLLRSALPRFLRVGDAAELRVFVRNATAADSDVAVTLKAAGVAVSGALTKSATVRAGTSAGYSWPARVEREGTVKLEFAAKGGDLEDAMALSLAALVDLTPETTATSGVVTRDDQLEAIYLPRFADTAHGTLSVNVRSALVGSMADELAYFTPWPHEGTPAVATRLIAALAVRRAERSAGGSVGRDSGIARDLAGLVGRQRPDGGWPWCDDPLCSSDLTITGWALLALGEARRDGFAIDAGVLERATAYAFAWVNSSGRPGDTSRFDASGAPTDIGQKAFVLAALAAAGSASAPVPNTKVTEAPHVTTPSVAAAARALFEQYRAKLSGWGRAFLALALVDAGVAVDDPQVRMLLDDLTASTLPSANGNHWEDQATSGTYGSFMTSTATTGLVALLLARVQPDHALLAQSVRWLVVARAAQRWQTSIDRALGVLALTTYAVNTGELGGDFAYRVLLDDRQVLAGLVKPSTTPTAASTKLPLTGVTPGKTSLLAFTRDGTKPGRLYYTLDLRYATPARGVDALNRGFAVSRSYTLLDAPSTPVTGARLGDTVRVTVTVIAPADRNYVVIDDPLPAGLEPVDVRLRTTDPALRAKLNGERVAASQRQAGGYAAPWLRWYYSPWQQVDVRDDRAVLMTDHLARGVYEYVYYARATTTGDFFVAPTHAEETYFPEVFGRTDSARFTVGP